MTLPRSLSRGLRSLQRGITTLAVTLLLLAIVTVIAIFATNTAFYELRTTNSENRARLAEQAAEYGVNLGGEYIKSQLDNVVSADAGGWLVPGAELWTTCVSAKPFSANHPCLAEAISDRRDRMYFRTLADDSDGDPDNDVVDLVAEGSLANVGGTAAFPVKTKISALLCRIDTSDVDDPDCQLVPTSGNNIAVTIVAQGNLTGESATANVKETWASYGSFNPASAVPLVASGTVEGLGNAQIVASPNAGGTGLAASVWSPGNVDIEASAGGGVGSVSTCHLGGFLGHGAVPIDDLLTTCAGTGNTGCGCPASGDPDFISGHSQAVKREGLDILDIDGSSGTADLPDITFFPGNGLDSSTDPSDDNLFEWIFNVNYIAEADGCNEDNAGNCSEDAGSGPTDDDCGTGNDEDCAVYAMREELGFEFVTCAQLNALGADAEGMYYVSDSAATQCTLKDQIGAPENDVIVVLDDEVRVNNLLLYGMLFVRSDDNTADMSGNGNAQVFGSVVVQGNVDLAGGIDLIYYDWGAEGNSPDDPPPPARYFGRVGGSWLDDDDGF